MNNFQMTMITIMSSVFASAGFWSFLTYTFEKKNRRRAAEIEMLRGLGHDRIIYLCLQYIDRKSISHDEYENLNEYLYQPYVGLNGNGTAKRLMEEVNKLPIKDNRGDKDELLSNKVH